MNKKTVETYQVYWLNQNQTKVFFRKYIKLYDIKNQHFQNKISYRSLKMTTSEFKIHTKELDEMTPVIIQWLNSISISVFVRERKKCSLWSE